MQPETVTCLALAGNELSGKGIGASVDAMQYGKDVTKLNSIINELYKNIHPRPRVVAPGGFYDKAWYAKFLKVSGPHVVDVVTHHIYNLGAGKQVFQELHITCYIGVSNMSLLFFLLFFLNGKCIYISCQRFGTSLAQ